MNTENSKVVNVMSWLILIILALLPFHAFLSVWFSSIIGHYTLLRLWKEVLLIFLSAGTVYILAKDKILRIAAMNSLLVRLTVIYIILTVVWGVAAYAFNKVTLKALGFGFIVNLRFLIFFLIVWTVASKSSLLKRLWLKFLIIPATLVIFFGILQRIVFPYDFLKHFGYGPNTIYPYETINHNINYPRIMSTLRGANPLGVYLILILTALAAVVIKFKRNRLWIGALLITGMIVLVCTYSRAAWIGVILSLFSFGLMSLKRIKVERLLLPAFIVLLISAVALIVILHNNTTFENIFFHTQKHSAVQANSDQGHIAAFKNGIRDVAHEPLGRGVGTAGPASVYNNNNVRIAENYYLQIAQEIGWAGMILFIAINYLVACELWFRRDDMLPRVLLASLIGISFVNFLSHAWTDDTISYLWWGLAGIALAPIITDRQKAHGKKIKAKS
jgi:hypothetical protein